MARAVDHRIAGLVAAIPVPERDRSRAFDDADAHARLLQAIEQAVERDLGAAEVVVPAGGVVMALMDKAGVTRFGNGAPVLNGIAGLVAMAEASVGLARLQGGTFTSRHLSHARPDPQERTRIAELYGPDIYPHWTP